MLNRGICGSLSSIPVDMGDCGAAYVDVSPEFPNLCFQIPLITTGGAKPLSLSLLYNERSAQSSSGGPFPGGFRLSLYRLISSVIPPFPSPTTLTAECADGPSRPFKKDADGRFRSPEDPAALKPVSGNPAKYRAYLNETDYLEYSVLNPYPLSCASSTAGTPAFTMSGDVLGPSSISLEGGRRLIFSYDADSFFRCIEVREEKEESGSWHALQTIRLQYGLSGDDAVLSRITAYLGSPGPNDLPFRDVSFSKGQDDTRVWKDELRSLEWSFAWDAQNSRVAHFFRKGPGFNDGDEPEKTRISYSADSSTVRGLSGHSKTTYFDGDLPYLSCDGLGVAEAFRFDGTKRRLLFRSGPVCLNPESALNDGQPLARPFFGPGAASAWSLPAGYAETDPIGIGPAPYPDNTGAVSSASLSQTVAKAGLPGDSFTFSALIRGSGSGSGKPSATIRLLKGGVEVASSARESIFPSSAGKPELLCVSATAPSSFDQISVSLTCDDPFVSEACLLLGRVAPLDAGYDGLGRLVEANPSSSALYFEDSSPRLVGGRHFFRRYGEPSISGSFKIQESMSMWGLRSEEGRDGSTFLPVWSESWVPGAQGSDQEWLDYDPDLLLWQERGAGGVTRSYEYAPGSDLPSGSMAGPDPSDPLLASEFSYSASAPWAVSSLSHSASDGLSWAFSYSYGSSYLSMSSASEGPSGALPADLMATSWSYDGLGNPTSVSQSSNAYASMAYSDQHGMRLLSSLSYGTGSFSWSYDAFGRPVSVSYAEPNQAPSVLGTYSYDEFGRPTQALGESYSWNDDGSLASLSCGSLTVSYSRFDAHSSESVSFNNENPTVISSHGPEACSYGDPKLGEALFQLIPGLSSAVFPEPENAGSTPWAGSASDLTLRGYLELQCVSNLIPGFDLEGDAVFLSISSGQHPRYGFLGPSAAASLRKPGYSIGGWFRFADESPDATFLQISFGASGTQADYCGRVRLASGKAKAAVFALGQSAAVAEAEASIVADGSWHFVCLTLSYGPGGDLASLSLRVDGAAISAALGPGAPSLPIPSASDVLECSFLGAASASPITESGAFCPGSLYAPFVTADGNRLSPEGELLAYQETKKALIGDPSGMDSPVAARSFLTPSVPSGFEAIAPLEGDFSLIAGTLGPSEVSAPSGPFARPGDAFRYDPAEHRFRYWPDAGPLLFESPLGDDPVCFAFSFRPLDVGGAADRCLCSLGIGALTPLKVVLRGSSVYLQRGGSSTYLGLAGPSSSKWLGIEFWVETRKVGIITRKAAMAKVYLGVSSFSSAQVELGPYLPVSGEAAFVRLGGDPSMPFFGFVDRFGAWHWAWSSSSVSALQSCFAGQKASVEEIDPFGQLASRSTHGPSGLSITTSFAPLVVQEGAESLRRPGLISSEGHSVNGTPVSSLGREHEYDYFGRLTESFAVGADHEEDDPLDSYEYDGLGRLKSWTDANGDKTQYTWEDGHVVKVKKGQLVTAAFSYSGHRLTSAYLASITYRSDAPMLVDRISLHFGLGTHCAVLSYMGRTVTGVAVQGNFSMTPCSFSYDARGRRTSKTSNGVAHSYFYEGSALIRESITGSPSHDIRFFYHMSGAPAFMTLDGVAYYYVVDAFGSVVGLVDGDGSLVVTYSYDPWGKVLSTTDTSGVGLANLNPLRYRSYYYDSETRWYLCGSRYYSPEWMRWVTPDSVDYLDPETPGGLDPYAYCHGDPVDYADPSGHFAIALIIALAVGFSTAGGVATQLLASVSSYIGIAVASLWDKQIRKDMDQIGWNPFNSDASKVLSSGKVSFFKGVPFFKTNANRSFSFGAVWLGNGKDIYEVYHEYGHVFQQFLLGPLGYALWIVIPSAGEWGVDKSNYEWSYYHRPWEAMANIFGGNYQYSYSTEDYINAISHIVVAKMFGFVSYLFGLW